MIFGRQEVKFMRVSAFKAIANVVVWIMLAGGVVFTAGFGLCLMIARQEVTKEVDAKVGAQINCLRVYVDGRLRRIEDAGYSLASAMFGHCVILMEIAYALWQVFATGVIPRLAEGCRKMPQSGWAAVIWIATHVIGFRDLPVESAGIMRMRRFHLVA